MPLNRRMQIVQHWLAGRRNGVSLLRLVKFFFGRTCTMKAKPMIKSIEEVNGHLAIHLYDIKYPLYYPKGLREHSIYQVIAETLCPDDWHRYDVEPTLVKPDDIIVDCGAAEGMFSLTVADRCKKVYAIEPLPAFVESMKLTFAEFDNFEIMPVALAASEGEGFLNENDIGSSLKCSNVGIPVKITTLDKLFFERGTPITFIKADLEGYDFEMIKGARLTIEKYLPKIAITTYHRGNHAKLISDFLKDINPRYQIKVKGIGEIGGAPVMLHAWID